MKSNTVRRYSSSIHVWRRHSCLRPKHSLKSVPPVKTCCSRPQNPLNFFVHPDPTSEVPYMRRLKSFSFFVLLLSLAHLAAAQTNAALHGYQKAPEPISQILGARPTPQVLVSPDAGWLLVADRLR